MGLRHWQKIQLSQHWSAVQRLKLVPTNFCAINTGFGSVILALFLCKFHSYVIFVDHRWIGWSFVDRRSYCNFSAFRTQSKTKTNRSAKNKAQFL